MHAYFRTFAHATSSAIGTPYAFVVAVLAVVVWAACGPVFGFSDTWQLVINTSTTIVTFLVVFMIQNTQNRDSRAIHLKLDELLRAMKSARNQMVDVEELSDEELERLEKQFRALGTTLPAASAASAPSGGFDRIAPAIQPIPETQRSIEAAARASGAHFSVWRSLIRAKARIRAGRGAHRALALDSQCLPYVDSRTYA